MFISMTFQQGKTIYFDTKYTDYTINRIYAFLQYTPTLLMILILNMKDLLMEV